MSDYNPHRFPAYHALMQRDRRDRRRNTLIRFITTSAALALTVYAIAK